MPPSQDQEIVVFGQGSWDGRAYVVAERLRGYGYKNVRLYAPGVNGWPRAADKKTGRVDS
jgi:rhodanese-related sulfurtransferase